MPEDTVRVLKIVEYVGPRSAVERHMTNANWTMRRQADGLVIRTAIVGQYPEVLEQAEAEPEPKPEVLRCRKCGGFTIYTRQNSLSGLCFGCESGLKP